MSRKSYDSYAYIDPDGLYTYPNTAVLINRYGEKDPLKASELEYRLVASQSIRLFRQPIEVRSMADVRTIHAFLFGGMYDWAGQYRKVNISKSGKAFMPLQSFGMAETYVNRLLSNFHQSSFSRDELIQALVEILDNLNYFHPFREGNGRCQREVIRSLALMKGYECEIVIGLDDEVYHLYMDGTVYSDKEKLIRLFDKLLSPFGRGEKGLESRS